MQEWTRFDDLISLCLVPAVAAGMAVVATVVVANEVVTATKSAYRELSKVPAGLALVGTAALFNPNGVMAGVLG